MGNKIELKNLKPGGGVEKALGITMKRLYEIATQLSGEKKFVTEGDMFIDVIQHADTAEEQLMIAFLLGGFVEKQKQQVRREAASN
jgi:hypothetical protein